MNERKKKLNGSHGSIQDLIDRKRSGDPSPPPSQQKVRPPTEEELLAKHGYREPDSGEDEAFLEAYKRKIGIGAGDGRPQPQRLSELRRIHPDELKGRKREQTPSPAPASESLPNRGDMLHLTGAENHVVLFERDVPSRGYQLVHLLNPDGTLAAQGISLLDAYEFRRIGTIPANEFDAMRQRMRWDRDLLVFHLDQFQDGRLIPHPNGNAHPSPTPIQPRPATRSASWPRPEPREEPRPAPKEDDQSITINGIQLQKAQWFKVSFGPGKEWEAVYIGRDKQGPIVAHKTGGEWTMMHLDLNRFANSLKAGEVQSAEEKQELLDALRGKSA